MTEDGTVQSARFEPRSQHSHSCRRGFRALSAIHLLDPGKPRRHEMSEGLEAVQKAVELKPDLILLDIRLPSLSGLEAARRIRKLAPQSKIIFVSQEFSADVVKAALSLGARGFVYKMYAASDLISAVETDVKYYFTWPVSAFS